MLIHSKKFYNLLFDASLAKGIMALFLMFCSNNCYLVSKILKRILLGLQPDNWIICQNTASRHWSQCLSYTACISRLEGLTFCRSFFFLAFPPFCSKYQTQVWVSSKLQDMLLMWTLSTGNTCCKINSSF